MPTLETDDGAPVELAPVENADEINAAFTAAMNGGTGGEVESAPPRRQPKAEKDDPRKTRTARKPREAKARTTTKPAGKPLGDDARRTGVKGLAQLAAGLFLMTGKATKSDAFVADAVIVASKSDELADACVETAQADERFAAALDRVCSAGPYAALIGVAASIGSQIARNHGAAIPGTMDPAELLDAQTQAETAAAAA